MPEDPRILAGNREVLARHATALAAIDAAAPYGEEFLSSARGGDPVIALPDAGGAPRPLHSRYEPRREAESQLPRETHPLATYVLFGGGLGYLPLALLPHLTRENRLLWVERDARLLRTAIGRVDLRAVLAHPGVTLFVATPARALYEHLLSQVIEALGAPVLLVAHPPSLALHEDYYDEQRRAVAEFSQHGSVQLRTALALSRRTAMNQASNLRAYLESPGLEPLRGALAGKPALIVAAGPSLRKNIDAVAAAAGHMTIISVSTTLKLLLARGIAPDFTTLIDYHRVSARYFEGIDPRHAPPMVAEMKAAPEAIAAYPGLQLFVRDPFFQELFAGVATERPALPPSATVSHAAFHLAAFLGADPIVFVGLDLAYPGGLIHVPGTACHLPVYGQTSRFYTFESREAEYYLSLRGRLMKVPAVGGGDVPTEDVFFSYLKEFEAHFARFPGRVIDATEGGARIAGTHVEPFASVLARYREARAPDLARRVREACAGVDVEARRRAGLARIAEVEEELSAVSEIYGKLRARLDAAVAALERGTAIDAE
ncbi:MAG: DUF115 domain-containing protein, partial [Planctomycetes bacterium]|nr:DUF115 domain-containing protein [Planctomycetota bacterium]